MDERSLEKKNDAVLVAILIVLSAGFSFFGVFNTEVVNHDGPLYLSQAQLFSDGNFSEAVKLHQLFLYPLLISCANLVFGEFFFSGQLISSVASIASVITFYYLTKNLFNKEQAFISSLVFLLCPLLNEYSTQVMRDPLFIFLLLLSVSQLIKYLEYKKNKYLMVGVLVSTLSMLVRMEGVFVIPLFMLFLIIVYCFDNRGGFFESLLKKRSIIFVFSVAFVFILIIYGASRDIGRLGEVLLYVKTVINDGLFAYDQGIKQGLKALEASTRGGWADNDFAAIARDNIRLIYLWGFMTAFKGAMFGPFFALSLVGIFWATRERRLDRRHLFLVFSIVAFLFIYYSYLIDRNFLEDRYLLAPVVLFLPWTGFALCRLFECISGAKFRTPVLLLTFVLVLCWPLSKSVSYYFEPEELAAKKMGLWISEQGSLQKIGLISNDNVIPFYAGRWTEAFRYVGFGFENIEKLGSRKRFDGITILTDRKKEQPEINGYSILKKMEDAKYCSYLFIKDKESVK